MRPQPDVPFLYDFPRAVETAIDPPYTELVTYLGTHRKLEPMVWRTLSYFAQCCARVTHHGPDGGRRRAARHHHAAVDRVRRLQRDRGGERDRRVPLLGARASHHSVEWQLADVSRSASA
jgi:acetyl xylan esterase AXE1